MDGVSCVHQLVDDGAQATVDFRFPETPNATAGATSFVHYTTECDSVWLQDPLEKPTIERRALGSTEL